MEWHTRLEQPKDGIPILIFSPIYPESRSMRYRIIDSQFFHIVTEATHWAELTPPGED